MKASPVRRSPWIPIGIVMLVLGTLVLLLGHVATYHGEFSPRNLLLDNYPNLGAILLGAVVTIAVVDSTSRRIQKGSAASETALSLGAPDRLLREAALARARAQGWVTDGTLRGAPLAGANLASMNLERADLRGANLQAANLTSTNLYRADLRGATLVESQCQNATLHLADLRQARLFRARLSEAQMSGADLRGASLVNAALDGADLENARMNHRTVLPDGSRWRSAEDLARFTGT